MDAILRKCLACGEPFTAIDRRSKLCPECRQNASRGSTYRGAENPDLSCLQGTSAFRPEADLTSRLADVRLVPETDITVSLNSGSQYPPVTILSLYPQRFST
jgi:hypothetical protein